MGRRVERGARRLRNGSVYSVCFRQLLVPITSLNQSILCFTDSLTMNKLLYTLFLGLLSLFGAQASVPVLDEKQAALFRSLMESTSMSQQSERRDQELGGIIEYAITRCPCSCTAGDKEGFFVNFGMFDACYDREYSIFLINTQKRVQCSGTGRTRRRCPRYN